MSSPIHFYVGFSSAYGYLGSALLEKPAARFGREAAWHPVLPGVVFEATSDAAAAHRKVPWRARSARIGRTLSIAHAGSRRSDHRRRPGVHVFVDGTLR